jgi:hypothetical protein
MKQDEIIRKWKLLLINFDKAKTLNFDNLTITTSTSTSKSEDFAVRVYVCDMPVRVCVCAYTIGRCCHLQTSDGR